MFCPYCGNPCADTHIFCFRCGKPLPEVPAEEPVCHVPAEPEAIAEPAPLPDAVPAELTEQEPEIKPEEAAITAPEVPSEEPSIPAEPAPQPQKGRLWPPLLALCLMICVGLCAYFLTPRTPEAPKSAFSLESGVLYFDYSLYTGPDELEIPATVDGMAVTAISQNCFADCDRLTTIVIPESVTIIGDKAFAGCDALRGVYIPDGVLSIGAGALAQCPVLEAVYLPNSLVEIGEGCLDDCPELQYILYDGTYAEWRELYSGIFQSQVELHTDDGVYRAQP